ncbi:SMP-30/gluconolactonase/LRE family protein [Caballeronia sp. NK8]|uniref:SMP-30/gluconolactonase/LRE family protein n=1 Tax=Caballeronia sp. NK8 TaxID=140098 RepID=UPI001BB4E4D7|nr:SMP-30/gluconolactonase/LRE family protein [Caballeronia sp. NK8]BCQ22365.1 SMP-30/gluconolactonase/LRE family protein [Caballeronia sp. NK8]
MNTWQPSLRTPDPAIRILDKRFEHYRLAHAKVERLWTGCRWAEGPVWFGDAGVLYWTDLPNDRILKWDEATEQASTWRAPSSKANGMTRDRQGRLIVCEHGTRRVTRTEYDGRVTVLADRFEGKQLNSPNDVVVTRDGSIWFTDPPFGLVSDYMGKQGRPELKACVYRIDAQSGQIECVADDIEGPNGLAFSPDERTLYVVASRARPRTIMAFDVIDNSKLGRGRVLIDAKDGTPDGFRVDVDGNLWCGWGTGSDELDGVRIFAPDGTAIGHIALPERCANLCFGGRDNNRLFMASTTSVYALFVNTRGAV